MLASFLTVLALSVQFVLAQDCKRSYTVVNGDYCDKISRENNVSTFQLFALNSDKINQECTNLAVGGVLCLGTTPDKDCQTTHTVKAGDTCDSVSSAAGTNTTILQHNNPQIDDQCHNIYIGEVLCTATSVQAPDIPHTGLLVPVPVPGSPASNSPQSNNTPAPPNNKPTPTSVISVSPSSTDVPYDDSDEFCD